MFELHEVKNTHAKYQYLDISSTNNLVYLIPDFNIFFFNPIWNVLHVSEMDIVNKRANSSFWKYLETFNPTISKIIFIIVILIRYIITMHVYLSLFLFPHVCFCLRIPSTAFYNLSLYSSLRFCD